MSSESPRVNMRGGNGVGWLGYSCLAAVVLALLFSDAFLIRQNRVLKADLRAKRATLLPPVGEVMPPLAGYSLSGMPESISYGDGRPTVLFVFTSGCVFCSQAWSQWQDLTSMSDPSKVHFVFVNVGGGVDTNFLRAHGVSEADLINQVNPRDLVAYNIATAPETIVVDGRGQMINAWAGPLSPAALDQLRGECYASKR